VTFSAKVAASVRQTRAAAVSNPEGAGASSRRLRKAIEDGLSIEWGMEVKRFRTDANATPAPDPMEDSAAGGK
jgi:hypothetical protein